MIDWSKGLTIEQEQLLAELLEQEKLIEPKYWLIKHKNNLEEPRLIFGRLLPKNKLIPERDSGYTYYIEYAGKVYKFSAFHYNISEQNEEWI